MLIACCDYFLKKPSRCFSYLEIYSTFNNPFYELNLALVLKNRQNGQSSCAFLTKIHH